MRYLIVIISLFIVSCNKCELGPQTIDNTTNTNKNGSVIILNEGNYGWGNASVDVYDPNLNNLSSGVFKSVNGYGPGDVVQSIREINGFYALVVNNSGKVLFVDSSSLEVIDVVSNLISPRYLCESNNKLYISDLYGNKITVVDLTSSSLSNNTINIEGWTEHMLSVNDEVFVALPDSGHIKVVSSITDQVVDIIDLTDGVGEMVLDKNGDMWVSCSGGSGSSIPKLYQIDPGSHVVISEFSFNLSDNPGLLTINDTGDKLYYLNQDIFEMSIGDSNLPATASFSATGRTIYAIGVDPSNGEIYFSDVKDYVQKSEIIRLDKNFQVLDVFESGIISNDFLFR